LYGESLDVEYSYTRADLAKIYQVCELKTAKYSVVGPLSVGLNVSKVSKVVLDAVSYFGINKNAFQRYEKMGRWYYEVDKLGFKCRIEII